MDQKAQFDAALSALRSGNLQTAVELCGQSLEMFPGDANFLCLSARTNLAMKNFSQAEENVEEAIRLFPDFSLAHETLGDLMMVEGKVGLARSAFETALRLDPTRAELREKIDHARQIEKSPTRPGKQAEPGQLPFMEDLRKAAELEEGGDEGSAEMIYRNILKKDPNHVEAARLLAGVATRRRFFRDAEVFLRKAVSLAPDYVRAWVDLTNVQREQDKLADALDSAKRVVELAPENAESYMVYASAIGMTGDHQEAINAYEKALQLAPDKPAAHCGMAHHLKTIGRQDDSINHYRQAIEINEDHAEAYWSLANLKTFSFRDDEVETMLQLLERQDLSDESRSQLNNALGLEYESRKEFDLAFENFAACNHAQRLLEKYDPVETEETTERIIEIFTPGFFEKNRGVQESDITPILIVGLPRSGSTLIEQILASHSQVDGTHELGDLPRALQAVRRDKNKKTRFPDSLVDADVGECTQIGTEYLRRTEVHRAGAPYFVDKNPNNFIYAGILKLAIPNAKIIDARRHPLDSCFGSFKQLFASGQPFSYDITELGEYYLQYRRLMDHWHEVLPGFVLEVNYEEVVADLEAQVRRILEYCGLPFEEACLRFHETERAVKTASSEQVRRPIYSSSVNLWRNYEPHIEELIQILEPLLVSLPEDQRPASLQSALVD